MNFHEANVARVLYFCFLLALKYNKKLRVLLIDHKDSFSYNLMQLLSSCGAETDIVDCNIDLIKASQGYKKVILSPGPGLPLDYPETLNFIKHFSGHKDIFGVCLGMQSMAIAFGAKLYRQKEVMHGRLETIHQNLDHVNNCLSLLPYSFKASLYHSWAVEENSIPSELLVTAYSQNGIVMGLQHKFYSIEGVQFHPESFLTEFGKKIISQWLYHNKNSNSE
ncbi:MAG: aminodeoxychorismate/anthranilate synthase component II [Saprospiraceae bacterium]